MRATPILLIALILAVPRAAWPVDIFVSNTAGSDISTGRQPCSMPDKSGPVRTITRALELARPGDRIVLENTGEPYRESITLMGVRHSGYALGDFVIEGNGAVLDGTRPVPAEAWVHDRGSVFRFSPPWKACQQLFLQDRPAVRVLADPSAGQPPELEPLQWCLYRGTIYFCAQGQKSPADYPLRYAHHRVGISVLWASRVEIRDLVVQGFQLDGINVHTSARHITLTGVVLRGNGRAGLCVGGNTLVSVRDSLIGDNGEAQMLALPYSETRFRNTRLLGNTAPAVVHQGGRVYFDGKPVEGGLDEYIPPSMGGQGEE